MFRICSLQVGAVYREEAEPVFVWYLEGGQRKILVDLGTPTAELTRQRLGLRGEGGGPDALQKALASFDVVPWDIDTVVLTHLHFDHVWNLDLFVHAQVIVQRDELMHAIKPEPVQRGFYNRDVNAKLISRKQPEQLLIVEGDRQVAPGLELVLCPGHTPGIQSVLVTTSRGVVALASDVGEHYDNWHPADPRATETPMAYLRDSFLPPTIHTESLRVCVASMARLRERASIVVPSHDARIPRRIPEEWWDIPEAEAAQH